MSKLTPDQKAHVEKWLDILENGMHDQGQGYLKVLHSGVPHYCCLGVAAEAVCGKQLLQREQVPYSNRTIMGYDAEFEDGVMVRSTMGLGPKEKKQLGLDKDIEPHELEKIEKLTGLTGYSAGGDRESVCVQMNDEVGLSFEEIAKVFKEMGWNE
jgi:hypothetical protein